MWKARGGLLLFFLDATDGTKHVADFRLQSNNPIIISSSPTGKKNMRPADSALGIFRSPGHDLCVPGRRILRPREPWSAKSFFDHAIKWRQSHKTHTHTDPESGTACSAKKNFIKGLITCGRLLCQFAEYSHIRNCAWLSKVFHLTTQT